VQAHLVDSRWLVGANGNNYEFGRFEDSAGDWLVVHALTAQGNSAAALTVSKAHQEFGKFDVSMFVGVAGSLKPDIPIGSVVIGDHVHNGHAGKVEDDALLTRPIGHSASRLLLTASQALIANEAWRRLIRNPQGMDLLADGAYADRPLPLAVIK
jgi:nucleoside phosphorylase